MKDSLRLLIICLLSVTLTTGCGKKKDANASAKAKETESERDRSAGEPGLRPVEPDGAAAAVADGAKETSAVSPEVAATDAAFEAYFRKYKLNLNDPKMLDEDPDGDGFTNREEFMADTNPHDAESRPGIHKEMRLKEFSEVRLPFVLKSVEGESARIERTEEGGAKVETVRAGQTIRGSQYKVERVQSRRMQDKDGHPIDASRVTLTDTGSKQRVDLVKDMPARSPASYAKLSSVDGSSVITVKLHDVFEWPGEPGAHYEVIDLRSEQVILRHVETGQTVTVPKP